MSSYHWRINDTYIESTDDGTDLMGTDVTGPLDEGLIAMVFAVIVLFVE